MPYLDWVDKERRQVKESDYFYRRYENVMKLVRAKYAIEFEEEGENGE